MLHPLLPVIETTTMPDFGAATSVVTRPFLPVFTTLSTPAPLIRILAPATGLPAALTVSVSLPPLPTVTVFCATVRVEQTLGFGFGFGAGLGFGAGFAVGGVAGATTRVTAEAWLLEAFESPGVETVTVFVSVPVFVAFPTTVTTNDCPGLKTPGRLQLTSAPPCSTEQLTAASDELADR